MPAGPRVVRRSGPPPPHPAAQGGPDTGTVSAVPKAHEASEAPESSSQPWSDANPLVASRPRRVPRPGHPALSDTNSDGIPDAVAVPTRTQDWDFDALGNWDAVTTDG